MNGAALLGNRLLRAFPEINNLSYQNLPLGAVKVHALEVQLNRRFSNGLTGVFSFAPVFASSSFVAIAR